MLRPGVDGEVGFGNHHNGRYSVGTEVMSERLMIVAPATSHAFSSASMTNLGSLRSSGTAMKIRNKVTA